MKYCYSAIVCVVDVLKVPFLKSGHILFFYGYRAVHSLGAVLISRVLVSILITSGICLDSSVHPDSDYHPDCGHYCQWSI